MLFIIDFLVEFTVHAKWGSLFCVKTLFWSYDFNVGTLGNCKLFRFVNFSKTFTKKNNQNLEFQ